MPVNLRTDCFDLFYYHLQKPIEHHTCKNELLLNWIFLSFTGIGTLGTSYFGRCAENKRRFATCWPSALKWLKAIFDGGFFHGNEERCYTFTFDVYGIALRVCEDALEENGAFEIAVTAWNGHPTQDGAEYYTARPLLAYLSCKTVGMSRIDHILNHCENDPDRLVDKILIRLRYATSHPTSDNVSTVVHLTALMVDLADVDVKSIRVAIFTPKIGRLLASLASSLALDASLLSTDHLIALRSFFRLIYGCAQLGPACASGIVGAGVLVPLLRWASFESRIAPDPRCSPRPCDILRLLLKHLSFNDMVDLCGKELQNMYASDVRPKDLLKTSSEEFQNTWQAFESVLLEQTVLIGLFSMDYATELGACACVSSTCSKFRRL